MTHKLDELAAKGQAKKHSRSTHKPKRRRRKKRKSSRRKLSEVLSLTLRRKSYVGWVLALTFTPMGIGAAVYFVHPPDKVLISTYFGLAIITVGAVIWFMRASANAELRWLGSVGFGLDVDDYLDALDRRQHRGSLVVQVTFAFRVPDEGRSTVSDAAIGASDAKSAQFQGDELVVESQSVKTYFPSTPGSDGVSYYSNAELHQWFRSFVEKGLRTIHETFPIERIAVSMKGD